MKERWQMLLENVVEYNVKIIGNKRKKKNCRNWKSAETNSHICKNKCFLCVYGIGLLAVFIWPFQQKLERELREPKVLQEFITDR